MKGKEDKVTESKDTYVPLEHLDSPGLLISAAWKYKKGKRNRCEEKGRVFKESAVVIFPRYKLAYPVEAHDPYSHEEWKNADEKHSVEISSLENKDETKYGHEDAHGNQRKTYENEDKLVSEKDAEKIIVPAAADWDGLPE